MERQRKVNPHPRKLMGFKRGRGYYTRESFPYSDHPKACHGLRPRVYDPEKDCPECKGTGMVYDDETNKKRHIFMRYIFCGRCYPELKYPGDSRK